MPWTIDAPPAAMRRLPPLARAKAVEIANALLAEGHPEGQAIRIAIARAKQWAQRRGFGDSAAHITCTSFDDLR